jgi:hypothetical protein
MNINSYEYNEGYAAAIGGFKRVTDNPYEVWSVQYSDWLRGYTDVDPWAMHNTNKGFK